MGQIYVQILETKPLSESILNKPFGHTSGFGIKSETWEYLQKQILIHVVTRISNNIHLNHILIYFNKVEIYFLQIRLQLWSPTNVNISNAVTKIAQCVAL